MTRLILVVFLLFLLSCNISRGEVVRIEIDRRVPFAQGHCFGRTGAYERISGRLHIEVDPANPANAVINDLDHAPRNARGRVECWTDFFLLKPVDPCRGNGCLLYDVNNRGNKLALGTFNEARNNDPETLADAGNGFLMRRGYAVLWCGWNGEVVEDGKNRLLAGVPIAKQHGRAVSGKAHVEICVDEPVKSRAFFWSPWGTADAFPAASLDNAHATLVMRPRRGEPAIEIARDRWAFGRWENDKFTPDPKHLYVKDGFRPGWLYDLVYTARDPRVSGLGLAAMRDCVSFFRHKHQSRASLVNPLGGHIKRAYVFGISQSGRLSNYFIYSGFNTDESRAMVFDGALIHVAGAGKGMFNHRFGMATMYGTQHMGNLAGSEMFPFAPGPQSDPLTGRRGDTLTRAKAAGHVPKMIYTQSSTEYWSRGASLLHTDVEGKRDLKLPPNVRVYLIAGSQHLGGGAHTKGICQQPRNTLNDRPPILRAMLVALDRWVQEGRQPGPSRYPRIDDGTLVDLQTFNKAFPSIPGVGLPKKYYRPRRLDFGPRFESQGIADIVPPKAGPEYNTLVPAVDADGNEIAGIRLPDIATPLGTHAGWNLRAKAYGAEYALAGLHGTYLPFAVTEKQRAESSDPRPAVHRRYPTADIYLARMTESALKLQEQGFLLPEDVVAILNEASQRRDLWKK